MVSLGTVTFLFTDLVGSTEILDSLGDDAAEVLSRAHFSVLRQAVAGYGGHEVKSLGDGLMAAFPSAFSAVSAAIAMQQAIERHNRRESGPALRVRVGLHAGEPVRSEDDYFGTAVVIAKRLCDSAEGGQILASSVVRGLVGSRGSFAFQDMGSLALKGLLEPVGAYAAVWEPLAEDPAPLPGPVRTSGGLSPFFPAPRTRKSDALFVGREEEMTTLRRMFEAATEGDGKLVMVVGEPGIGKTALCEQLALYAGDLGGQTLIGNCYEEGGLSLPYQPFVDVLRSYFPSRDVEDLRRDLSAGATDIARLVPELKDALDIELRPPGDPADDRWRLLQAVTTFLRGIADTRPLLLILEDLHWADRGTLDLLLHLARNLQGSRVLVGGTYRDVEVDRAHPLSSTLAELRRVGNLPRILLRGLTVDEVQGLYNTVRGQEVPRARAEAVHSHTEGNPLFVQEVLRYTVEAGLVAEDEGRWRRTDDGSPEGGIPEGLRDVIGKRLSYLSGECNQMLSVASVIGREFDLETLRLVSDLDEERLITAIEQAQHGAVLQDESRPGVIRYRFAHALYRQTLYEEISAPRRLRYHQQVARALEAQFADQLDDHAAELAEHFSHSTDSSDLTKAVRYSELAAQRAMSVFAYGEAARLLERALDVQAILDPNDKAKRCDLLLALGEAMLPQEDPVSVSSSVAEEAFALGVFLGDSSRAAHASLLALEALGRSGAAWVADDIVERSQHRMWASRAELHAQPGTAERVYADIHVGMAEIIAGRPGAGTVHLRTAVEKAFELDDNAVFFAAAGWGLGYLHSLADVGLKERLSREVLRRLHGGAHVRYLGVCLDNAALHLLAGGEREAAEGLWRDSAQLAEHVRDTTLSVLMMGPPALLAFVDGRLEEALSLFEAIRARAQELGVVYSGVNADICATELSWHLGRLSEDSLESYELSRSIQANRALKWARIGRHADARAIREQFGDIGAEEDASAIFILLRLFEAAIFGSDAEMVGSLSRRLAPLAGRLGLGPWPALGGSIGRLLGEASVLLGNPDEARAYYAQALAVCEKVRFRPEIALTRLDLAELLLKHFPAERGAAFEHLDFVTSEFETMGMAPALERALRLRGRRRPSLARKLAAYPDGLSEREVEVLRLIARGKSNPQIADELVISINTVQRHASNIFAKAGLANRAEAAAYAQRSALT